LRETVLSLKAPHGQEARYALVISLETPGWEVDLHTPISGSTDPDMGG